MVRQKFLAIFKKRYRGSGKMVFPQATGHFFKPPKCQVSIVFLSPKGLIFYYITLMVILGLDSNSLNQHAVLYSIYICDVMGQNQSHVAKHKMAEICIFPENVKICLFFVFIKNKIFM